MQMSIYLYINDNYLYKHHMYIYILTERKSFRYFQIVNPPKFDYFLCIRRKDEFFEVYKTQIKLVSLATFSSYFSPICHII